MSGQFIGCLPRPIHAAGRPPVACYGVAIVAVAVAVAVRVALRPVLSETVPFISFFPAVLITAWLGGVGPGLVAVVLSTAAGALFLSPAGSFAVPSARDQAALVLFFGAGAGITALAHVWRSAQERAVSERMAAERAASALAASERRYRDLFEHGADLRFTLDVAGVITAINDRVEEMTGHHRDTALGRPLAEFVVPEHRPALQALLARASDGPRGSAGDALDLITRDRRRVPFEVSVRALAADGVVVGVQGSAHDLTEHRTVEAALRASEERFRTIAEIANEGIWLVDCDARTIFANRRMADLLGTTPDAITGRAVAEFCFAADIPRARERIGANLEGRAETFDFRFRRADGSAVEVLAATGPMVEADGRVIGALGMFSDITARRQAESARRQLAAIVQSSEDAIIGKTLDAVITSWNAGAERMYGYSADEAIGRPIAMLVPDDRPDEVPAIMARIRRGEGSVYLETERVRKDGTHLAVAVTISPIRDEAGTIVGASTIARDITARRHAAAEREQLLASEQAARAAAQEALATRDAFVAGISHDLKTPLAALKGQAQLLRRLVERQVARPTTAGIVADGLASRMTDGLAQIDATATRMAALVAELVDAARLQTGQTLDLRLGRTDLVALVGLCLEEARGVSDRHTFRMDCREAALVGEWDGARLARVFSNLIGNAVKYSPGGGEIVVTVRRIDMTGDARTPAGIAVVEITDPGLGIPADDLPHIFERYRRGTNVGAIEGSGLGLAGVKQIIEQHGGCIAVTSCEGAGTTVTVRLPIHPPGA